MKYQEILTEMLWTEVYSGILAAKQHPGALIHFSHINKLGINPNKTHRDPPGIYFYPIRWLLGDDVGLSQYGHHMEYYFICKLKPGLHMLNLGHVTSAQARGLASRNGWLKEFEEILADPKLLVDVRPHSEPKRLKKPGYFLYSAMDYLANKRGKSWLAMLKGFDGIVDPGTGTIVEDEPFQYIVFKTGDIEIIEQGENRDNSDRIYAGALKRLVDEKGGRMYFQNKVPCADFVIDDKPISIFYDWANYKIRYRYIENGYYVTKSDRLYHSSVGDQDSSYRDVAYALKQALEKASSQIIDTYWNKKVYDLCKTLAPRLQIRQHVTEDGILDTSSHAQEYYHWISFEALTGPEGNLKFEFKLEKIDYKNRDDDEKQQSNDFVMSKSYPKGSTIKTVYQDVENYLNAMPNQKLADWIKRTLGFGLVKPGT